MGERSTYGAQLLGHPNTVPGYLFGTGIPHQPKNHCIINKISPTMATSAILSAKIFSVLRRFRISCSQSKSIVSPPSALVPPCADAMRGVRKSPRPTPDAPLFSNSCTVLVGFNPDVPLRAGSPGAGQPGTSQSYLGTGPLPHSVTVPPGGHIALRSAYPDRAGQPFTEPPGDLPQTGSPDSPEASRLGDVSGAL